MDTLGEIFPQVPLKDLTTYTPKRMHLLSAKSGDLFEAPEVTLWFWRHAVRGFHYNPRRPWEGQNVRTMMKVSMPVEAANAAIKNGSLGTTIQKILAELQPESAYFIADDHGERTGIIVFDLKDSSHIPAVAEPWFLAFNARITMHPAMNAQDLAASAAGMKHAVEHYGK